MGRGDKRTKKGKIFRGSYGKARPRTVAPKAPTGDKKDDSGAEKSEETATATVE